MKKNIQKNLIKLLKSKVVLTVSGGMLLSSCVIYTGGGYTETDGVYYDPNKDVLPQVERPYYGANQVGDEYNYDQVEEAGVIARSAQNQRDWNNRYHSDNWRGQDATSSDWGTFSGSETNYYNHGWGMMNPYWGWGPGFGWGWGSRFGWGGYYGAGFGWGWGATWGWNSPWGWNDPFWGFYGPRWGMMNPYWGWGGFYGANYWGNGYYGVYTPSNRLLRTPSVRLSGADGNYYNRAATSRTGQTNNGGFRTNNNTFYQRSGATSGVRNNTPYSGMRSSDRTSSPTYRGMNNNSYPSGNSGGFRSSGDSGGFRSSGMSGGGFRGGGSSGGGGMRSGGGGGMRSGGR
ncbi:prolyl-tRNA synthetase [Bergeyella sp. RCAD1439]|uniref:prolyl-tRNA synthetase n=1 Tax=Bergeyella anatis TaxID=3113737 RepID=UPI002E186A87|nr:prolyl-tRNA synthetase [Bergeyella sp. RCAD1439]